MSEGLTKSSKGQRVLSRSSGQAGEVNLPLPFCSIQATSGVEGVHPHWGGPWALPSSPIPKLISSRHPKIMCHQLSGHPVAHKVTHHSYYKLGPYNPGGKLI